MNIKQTDNLYENWIKKPEMIFILKESIKIPLFNENRNIIYMAMIEVIYNNINKYLHLLTTDNLQLEFYKNKLNKIYLNLCNLYNIKYYKIYNYGLWYYHSIYSINDYFNLLVDYNIDKQYLPIETFFRGIHQIIEINLLYLMEKQDKIDIMININNNIVKDIIYSNISIWSELIELLNLLSSLDELQYQKYRNLIYGTSGGESINLRKIQRRIQNVDQLITDDIKEIIMNKDEQKY